MTLPVIIDLRDEVSPAEWETRCDLAAAYRHIARQGWDDLLSTHLSARVPDRALYSQDILAYHDDEGLALDVDERATLARDLGEKWLMMLRNHGTLSVGRTVGQAYTYLYFLEMACKYQTRTLSCGVDLVRLPAEVIDKVPKQATHIKHMGTMEWPALRAVLDVAEPDYAT